MKEKVTIIRKARIDSGKVFIQFLLQIDDERKRLLRDRHYIRYVSLSFSSAALLSDKLFNSLEPRTIQELFGQFVHTKFCDAEYNWPVSEEVILPAKKKCIREFTIAVIKWFENGLKKAAEEHEKRRLDDWLKEEMNFEFTVEVPNTEKTEETAC